MHRNEKYWPQPEVYRPERFLDPEEVAARHPNAHLPFGAQQERAREGGREGCVLLRLVLVLADPAAPCPPARPARPPGLGPRNCIGWRFAWEELHIALVRLYQRYTFTLSEQHDQVPLQLRMSITLAPKDGVWVNVLPRGAA